MYELAPLRRVDVIEAARVSGIDPPTLLIDEVFRQNIVPLAIKPITLQFLLNIRRKQAGVPSTQGELYAKGCRLLCEEPRQGRRPSSGNTNDRSADQRLAVASRIAAITIFCARDVIRTDLDQGEVPIEDIRIGEMVAGDTGRDSGRTTMDQNAIWQALNTGLFSSRGLSRIGWAHQTYAEFLAAKFLVDCGLSPERMMSLLVGSDGRVVPQLRETAAWLASMVPAVFQKLVATEPMTLLESDAGGFDLKERSDLTASLLSRFQAGQLLDLGWGLWQRYPKLNHPQLEEQLRPYIQGKDKGVVVRRVAMMIAQTCEIASLEPDLVAVSVDSSEHHELRVSAAFAISQFGSATSKQMLRPLVITADPDDPDDDLKGCGLLCTWPGSITASELFDALTHRKQSNRMGLYDTFLRKDIVEDIAPNDLPLALGWTERELECRDSISPFSRLADEIRAKALGFLQISGVAAALAGSTWRWLTTDGIHPSRNDKFKRRLAVETKLRRRLVILLTQIAATAENFTFYLCHGQLISAEDFSWLLDRHGSEDDLGLRMVWIDLIRRTFDQRDNRRTEALVEASKTDRALAVEFTWFLDPDSPEARLARERQSEWESSIPKPPTPPPLDPPPSQRVLASLQRIESGDVRQFVQLNLDLTLRPDSTRYREEDVLGMSWTKLAGWNDASDDTKRRIVAAAKRYLTEHSPADRTAWVTTDSFPWEMLAAYRALFLLLDKEPAFLDGLRSEAWGNWASITLAHPLADEDDGDERHNLLTRSYKGAPAFILETLGLLVEKENDRFGNLFVLQRLEPIWDSNLSTYLVGKLSSNLKLGSFGLLLSGLLRHGSAAARELAEGLLANIPASDGDDRERAAVAARALLRETEDGAWATLWPIIRRDVRFGLKVFEGVGTLWETNRPNIGRKLTDEQLGDLYLWMVLNVPVVDASEQRAGFAVVGPSQSLAWLRDILLTELKGRGTPSACAALRRAVKEMPQYPWLTWHLMEAEQFARSVSWRPLEPSQLGALIATAESRLVQNADQLLEVLIQSLERLEQEMQGETPAGFFLWDEQGKDGFHPKNELRISDCLKLHFARDIVARGIVVNREVEIRKGTGGAPGEETDIHVDAVIKGSLDTYGRVSVVVEVKGCWNRELLSAMKTQLADRYLKDNASPYGLYVVGWFMCDQWKADPRKTATPDMTLAEARDYFKKQAVDLSSEIRRLDAFVLNLAQR